MLSKLSCLLSLAVSPLVFAACECGYKTNTQEVFQFAVETSFGQTSTASFANSADWAISSVVFGESESRPIATNYTTDNVKVSNRTLQLTCSAYNANADVGLQSAQIYSKRSDILYGSFRATFSVAGNASGVVSALFFYANDTTEVDIELLTRKNPRSVTFTNQPDSSSDVYMPDGVTRANTNNYRLDWNQQRTAFFVNNVLSDTKTTDVPSVNGSIYLNTWGGSTFAGTTPPATDVTMTVSGIQLYFNTSDSALSTSWAQTCQKTKAQLCQVDQQGLSKNTTSTSVATPSRGGKVGKGKGKGKGKGTEGKTGARSRHGEKLGPASLAVAALWNFGM